MRHTEKVRDNQWWYTKHPECDRLDRVSKIVLLVDQRRSMMTHSQLGRDGRITRSVRFDLDSDRAAWVALRGRMATIEVEPADEPGSVPQALRDHIARPSRDARRDVTRRDLPSRDRPMPELPEIRRGRIPTLFGAYLFCDWSAASEPKTGADSIWLADGWFEGDGRFTWGALTNPATRQSAERVIRERVLSHRHAGRRTLVGLDFPFGYPASSLAPFLGEGNGTWRGLWKMLEGCVQNSPANANNRFEVASAINKQVAARWYWGCPKPADTLASTKDGRGSVAEFRLVEESLRSAGRRPFSVWQLYGNGSVGSQSLVGLPVCERLRADDDLGLGVWPFETGFSVPDRATTINVLAEVWPGAVAVDESLHTTKDAAQVLSLVRWAAMRDAEGTLAPSFEVNSLVDEERARAEKVEGWILGWMG
jgi:hypothetical protein